MFGCGRSCSYVIVMIWPTPSGCVWRHCCRIGLLAGVDGGWIIGRWSTECCGGPARERPGGVCGVLWELEDCVLAASSLAG
jgi:hypothetical protein